MEEESPFKRPDDEKKRPSSSRVNLFFRSLRAHNQESELPAKGHSNSWSANQTSPRLWNSVLSSPSPVRVTRIPASTIVLIKRQTRNHSERISAALGNWLSSDELASLAEQVCRVIQSWLVQAKAWSAEYSSDVIKLTVAGHSFPLPALNFITFAPEQKGFIEKLFENNASDGEVLELFKFSEFGDSIQIHLAISYDGGRSSKNSVQGLTVQEWIDFFENCIPSNFDVSVVSDSQPKLIAIDESSPWFLPLRD
jgi:hypothetical protein